MQQNRSMTDLQTLLYFPLKDSESRNRLLIASALGFASFIVPIVPWLFILGYAGAIMRQIIVDRQAPSMPDWKDWKDYLPLGGKLFGVNFIYSIPVFFPILLGYFGMMMPALLGILSGDSYNPATAEQLTGIMMVASFGGMALFGLGMFFSLMLWIILPPALSHAAATGTFAGGFQLRAWWPIFKANLGGFFLSLVIGGGLYMMVVVALQVIYMTMILCIILPFLFAFVTAYLTIILFTLFAQAYHDGVVKLEEKNA